MLEGIKGIAFDLDGTLYPNYQFYRKLTPFVFKHMRLLIAFGRAREIIRHEQTLPDFSPGFKEKGGFYQYQAEITAKLLAKNPPEQDEIIIMQEKIDRLIYKGWEPLFKKVKLFKNALFSLNALKEAGFKLALLSDFPPETKLEYLGLNKTADKYPIEWDAVLCSEECGALKPHPLPFLETASAVLLPPEKVLYVGNSHPYDVAGAHKSGMKTAWIKGIFPPGGKKTPKADFIFHNYRQFLKYMLK